MCPPASGLRAANHCCLFSLVFSSEWFPLVFTRFLCPPLNSFWITVGVDVAHLFFQLCTYYEISSIAQRPVMLRVIARENFELKDRDGLAGKSGLLLVALVLIKWCSYYMFEGMGENIFYSVRECKKKSLPIIGLVVQKKICSSEVYFPHLVNMLWCRPELTNAISPVVATGIYRIISVWKDL